MTHSALTDQVRESTTQRTPRKSKIDTFLIHHQAGTNDDSVIAGMQAHSGVSANYTISNEGRLTLVVNEDFRAWTSGSKSDGGRGAAWDHRAITVEIENETGAPEWRISQAAIDKAALLLNDLRARYGVSIVLGHRDLWNNYQASYATYCPGPDTVARIVARAAELADPAAVEAAKARVRKIAAYLNSQGLASFKSAAEQDGIPLDPGETYSRYWELVQRWGAREGVYDATVNSIDGIVGPNTRRVEAILWERLNTPAPPPVVVEPEPVEPEPADPDPVPVEPADPDPEEEPVAETPVIEVPVRVKLDDEALAGLLAKTKEAPEPSQPVVPDAVAKPLWVGLSMVAVSAGPVVVLTLIDWSAWDATIGQQFATTVTAWAGSIAAVLGLSRFAKSK